MKGSTLGRIAEWTVTTLLWTALVVGSSVLTLTAPVYTSALTQALGVPQTAGVSSADVVTLSERVRALVADTQFDPLPATWKGQPAFDQAAVSHLLDVRRVISGARLATGIAALLLAVYVGWCLAKRRFAMLSRGMLVAAIFLTVAVALAVFSALTSFDELFITFHGLFFAPGTWMFPADSMLIRLFPERFWEASGAAWAGMSLVGAGLLAVAAKLLRTTAARMNASRTANNV